MLRCFPASLVARPLSFSTGFHLVLITMAPKTPTVAALGVFVALLICSAEAAFPYAPSCPHGGSDIREIQRAIKANYTTCTEIISGFLSRTKKYNAVFSSFISVLESSALNQAASLDAFYQGQSVGPRAACARAFASHCSSCSP